MSFYKQIRIYIMVFMVFGLWTSFKNAKCKLALRLNSVFSIAIVIFLYTSAIYLNAFFAYTTIAHTVANYLYLLIVSTHLIVIVESIIKSKHQSRLIQKFTLIDRLFQEKLKIFILYKNAKRQIFIRNLILIAIFASMKGFLNLYIHFNHGAYNFMWIELYSVWVLYLRHIQVLFFIGLMKTRLNLINDELENIKKGEMCDRLLHLKQIYSELYEICQLIDMAFGWSLLATITQNFVDITSNCYWEYTEQTDTKYKIIGFILLAPHVIMLTVLCSCCSSCQQQVMIIDNFMIASQPRRQGLIY